MSAAAPRRIPLRPDPAEATRTTRLHLERLRGEHLDELAALHADPRVMATLAGVRDREATRAWLEGELAHWERHGFGLWLARRREDGGMAGRGGLRHTHVGGRDEVELAYAIRAELWGGGLAGELAEAALALGFTGLGLEEVVCFTQLHNRASLRVMEKAGFRFERDVVHAELPHRLFRIDRAARGEPHYTIRQAREVEITALAGVERAAARLFAGRGLPELASEDVTPAERLAAGRARGLLWVAAGPGDRPVGFALVEPLEAGLHLHELSVHPAHGRRGLGAALVDAVCDEARARRSDGVTLTTFREVAWNAPYYRRLGFRALAPEEITPGLAERVRAAEAAGLRARDRVVMRRPVGDATPG